MPREGAAEQLPAGVPFAAVAAFRDSNKIPAMASKDGEVTRAER
jgi:hypothetical protein